MRTPHTSTYKGKMVGIKLKTGEVIIGKFYNKNNKNILLGLTKEERKTIPISEVKSFKIVKGESPNYLHNVK